MSDCGLLTRIIIGSSILLVMALADLRRHGRRATRWREYLFLIAAVVVAMLYGAVNDSITSKISWEYFYYGKDLMQSLGPNTPPDPAALAWSAAAVGIKATWSAGLIVGVAMLMANNPKPGLPQLSYPRLLRLMPIIFLCCLACAMALGIGGYRGWLIGMSSDFGDMVRRDEFRPYRFMAVFGIHLGGYIGGLIGTVWAVICIRGNRNNAHIG
jgi:hypothetical protein